MRFTALLVAVILISYVARILIERAGESLQRGRAVLVIASGLLLTILCYFKYTNFFLSSLHGLIENIGGHLAWTTLKIILPAGISFYIFQAISYIVTIYRRHLSAEKSLIK